MPADIDPRPASLVPDAATVAIVAYGELRDRVSDLLGDVTEEQAATFVPGCPAWTVTDTLAHMVGVCIDIVDGAIGDDVGTTAWADSHVTRFAGLGIPGLLERWQETAPVIDSLAGLMADRIASQFVFDACTHEHDLRGALGRPGARDSSSLRVGLGFVEMMLDGLIRGHDLPSLLLDLGDECVSAGPLPTSVALTADRFDVFRAFGGRRSVEQIRAMAWTGDPTPYLEVFAASPLSPPEAALVE